VVTKRYLALLGFLYRQDPKGFDSVLELSGRHRKYFGRSRGEIASSGKSLHPRQIPDAPFWVMTNADTAQKQELIQRVLTVLGFERSTAGRAARAIA
jgi:negative modulator of initiation of replication